GDLAELVYDGQGTIAQRGGHPGPSTRLDLSGVLPRVLAGEHAPLQGRPGRHPEAHLEGHRYELTLDRSLDQRVLDLQGHERRPAFSLRDRLGLRDLPGRRVRKPAVSNL